MEKKCLVFCSVTLSSILVCFGTVFQSPIFQQKFGNPLYDGIKLLIADERYYAQLVWNETAYHLTTVSNVLEKTMEELSHYDPTERLQALNDMMKHPNWGHCYKEYEREIAHFNREFITKYSICKQTLDIAAAHLEDETFEEIDFIRNAAKKIQGVFETCKVSDLKRKDENHVGVTLCVVSHIGQIDQRLLESSQLILDIIVEITMSTDIEDDNCHAYNELKQEFDQVNNEISNCLEEFIN